MVDRSLCHFGKFVRCPPDRFYFENEIVRNRIEHLNRFTLPFLLFRLKQRLNNLSTVKAGSQESGINRIGLALPNTNKNALECSNPLYNDEKKMPDIDQSR